LILIKLNKDQPGFNAIKEMSNEDKIRREERFSAISNEQRNAKRYLIQIQEERGLPVRREGKFTGIWYAKNVLLVGTIGLLKILRMNFT